MKFNFQNLEGTKITAKDAVQKFSPPLTMGAPDGEEKAIADACFEPVKNMLAHSLELLSAEGVPQFPGYAALCGLTQNGLIRSGVEMRAKEMTRKWGELNATEEQNERIDDIGRDLEKYKVRQIFRDIACECGFLGGCLLFIDTGADVEELVNPLPLTSQTFTKGSLRGFKIVDPWVVYPGVYNSTNPLADDYFKPKVWYVQGIPVSSTRLIRFTENELPDMIKPAYNFFGLSLSQKVLDAVSHFTRNRESASKLLEKISLVVLKTDMSNILSGQADKYLKYRMEYFTQNWDFRGVAAIDKETEDLSIFNNGLAGVVDIVRQSMEYVAAMFNEPATKLWGISPAGMNATGESDMKNHYDNIAALQEQIFRPGLERIIQLLQMNRYGNIDPSITFTFTPLSDEADRTLAETNKMKAETAEIYTSMGAVSAEDVRNALIKDPDSGYNDLDPYAPIVPTKEEFENVNLDI